MSALHTVLEHLVIAHSLMTRPVACCHETAVVEGKSKVVLLTVSYRSHTILALPRLQTLDGRPVTHVERLAAATAVQQEHLVLSVMLRNACAVHKMVCAMMIGVELTWPK